MGVNVCESDKCKGCGLCQNICPVNCISFIYDEKGFLNPIRDLSKCINCNICTDHCILNGTGLTASTESIFFCAKSKDQNNLSNSSSGGMFGELAKVIIEIYHGVVYGAVYENTYQVRHVRAETLKDTVSMHYSKYVQSDTSEIYKSVKRDLIDERTVLFTGTPCQIVALKSFLAKDYEKLYCMDVLCFGVMSTSVLRDYIRFVLPAKEKMEGIDVFFRAKMGPDSQPSFVISRNGVVLHKEGFYGSKKGIGRGFGGGFTIRKSCFNCEFQSYSRYSDISVGDYVKQNVENDFSNSLLLINTDKGKELLSKLDISKQLLSCDEKEFSGKRVSKKTPINRQQVVFFRKYGKEGISENTVGIWGKKTFNGWEKLVCILYTFWKRYKR